MFSELCWLFAFQHPANAGALGLADPVCLHQANFLRPVVQRFQAFQKLVGKGGDLEEPLGQLALFDGGAGAPALAVDHLLIGKDGVVDRVPVDLAGLAISEAAF